MAKRVSSGRRAQVFWGANSSRPTGSFRQRPKTRQAAKRRSFQSIKTEKISKSLD